MTTMPGAIEACEWRLAVPRLSVYAWLSVDNLLAMINPFR